MGKDAKGEVKSVSIKDKKGKDVAISPSETTVSVNGVPHKYKITQKDMQKFADLNGKKVHLFASAFNGRPIDIKTLTPMSN